MESTIINTIRDRFVAVSGVFGHGHMAEVEQVVLTETEEMFPNFCGVTLARLFRHGVDAGRKICAERTAKACREAE
jgi:hypothetical protein